jgi:hypothetical protein
MDIDAKAFAEEWVTAWNAHDLERILSHYRDDVEIITPMIKMSLGVDAGLNSSGSLVGKAAIADYWRAALEKMPDLHFELLDVCTGVNSIAVYYKSVMDKLAIEVMEFDNEDKVERVVVHYC